MQRVNFTLDSATLKLLDRLADNYYSGNKSQTVRAALESLAAHAGHEGWVIAGYTPVVIDDPASCRRCGDPHARGDVLYRPVFTRGEGAGAVDRIPTEDWLACSHCVETAVN